jgi:hypothetical protein
MSESRRIKAKGMKEITDRYAESALVSAIRLRRYWLSQGKSEDVATVRAFNQALGMMASSGVSIRRLREMFAETEDVSRTFGMMFEEIMKEEAKSSGKRVAGG